MEKEPNLTNFSFENISTHKSLVKTKFLKLLHRSNQNVQNGRFSFFSKKKKQHIYKRLKRYAQRFSLKLRWTTAGFAISMLSSIPSFGQNFTKVETTNSPFVFSQNPLKDISFGNPCSSTFGDIDGDGDLDVFIGIDPTSATANIFFRENIGSVTNPILADTLINPFGLSAAAKMSSPNLIDIDDDGDLDLFVGDGANKLNYYENIGTNLAPSFSFQGQNPFGLNLPASISRVNPAFVDIDDDGDMDLFLTEYSDYCYTHFFENQGTSSAPSFAAGVQNAFGLSAFGYYYNIDITFQDIDDDGDMDLFNDGYGFMEYRENIGTNALPQFTTATFAPFNIQVNTDDDSPNFVDIDADGDFDFVNGSEDGNFFLQINDSGSTPSVFIPSEVNVQNQSAPSLVDIDDDGDLDAFVGSKFGVIYMYKNNGTAAAPSFDSLRVGNPYGITATSVESVPTFVDINDDGDLDLFVGFGNGGIRFLENTGDANNPVFVLDTNTSPFGLTDVGNNAAPSFIDIDNDGDLDGFVGNSQGEIIYFENIGGVTNPFFNFAITNAFGFSDVGFLSNISFLDIDEDGDFDAFVGEADGNINFFENLGTVTNPVFALSPATEPFGLSGVNNKSKITFSDIDNDNNFDAIIGENRGGIVFFENTTVLPVELSFFRVEKNNNKTQLIWQTESEQNNAGFEIERAAQNGNVLLWKRIGYVAGNGSTTQSQFYSFQDTHPQKGNNYYRLKQLDFDGKYEYSNIEVVQFETTSDQWTVFPNPVNELLQISGNQEDIISLKIIDSQGTVVRTHQKNTEVNVSDLPEGQYHLQIHDLKTDYPIIKPFTIIRQ